MESSGTIRLGEWLVNPDLDRITRGDTHVSLQPQVMDLLVYLARHHDEVISVDELLSNLWKDRVVTTASVYSGIRQLREALGDDVHQPRYIKTIPKRGYRLSVTPEFLDKDSPASRSIERGKEGVSGSGGSLNWRIIALVTAGMVLALFTGYLYRAHVERALEIEPDSVDAAVFEEPGT